MISSWPTVWSPPTAPVREPWRSDARALPHLAIADDAHVVELQTHPGRQAEQAQRRGQVGQAPVGAHVRVMDERHPVGGQDPLQLPASSWPASRPPRGRTSRSRRRSPPRRRRPWAASRRRWWRRWPSRGWRSAACTPRCTWSRPRPRDVAVAVGQQVGPRPTARSRVPALRIRPRAGRQSARSGARRSRTTGPSSFPTRPLLAFVMPFDVVVPDTDVLFNTGQAEPPRGCVRERRRPS